MNISKFLNEMTDTVWSARGIEVGTKGTVRGPDKEFPATVTKLGKSSVTVEIGVFARPVKATMKWNKALGKLNGTLTKSGFVLVFTATPNDGKETHV